MRNDYTIALVKRVESARREESDFKHNMMSIPELAEPLLK